MKPGIKMSNSGEPDNGKPLLAIYRGVFMLQILIVLSAALLVGLDQLTKWLATAYLQDKPFVLIKGVLELNFQTNPGIAFGLYPGYRILFIVLTSVALLLLFAALMSGKLRRYKIVNISGTLIIAGGVGNLIDRIFRGEVVDFIYIKLINFPVFNLADSCIVVGAVLLLLFFLFFYSDDKESNKGGKDTKKAKAGPDAPLPVREEGSADENANADAPAGQNGGKA